MNKFIFDLQRFADVTIAAGESYSLDGVTYTATTDSVLNLDSDNKVSGIASGKVTAVVTGMENSPTVTFDGTTPLEFTCAGDDNKLKVTCAGSSVGYTSGNVTYSSSGVTFQSGTVGLSGLIAKIIPYSVNLDIPTAGFSATFDGDNLNLKSPDTVTATLNLPEGLSVLLENLKGILPALLKVSEPTFEKIYDIAQKLLTTETSLKLSGEATYNRATKTLSFAQDSTADINALGYEVNLKAVDGALDGISVYYQKDGEDISAGVKMSAGSGNGKLKLDVLQNGVTLFDDLLKVTNGTLTFDPINAKILMDADTSVSMTVRDIYTATITANNALSTTFSADEQGNIVLTPENFSVKATLQRDGTTIFDGAISIENGSLFFNQEAHSINVTKGTTLTLKQGDNSFSFTATDDAGIKMVADNDGNFTVTPGENDGSLDVTIKRGDTPIFSNNVSVVGEISFNPTTQSLGLADGTKISTKFGDYEVTATADGDAAVSVAMTSAGLSITPVEGDGTLNLKLESEKGSLSANVEVLSGSFILGENDALTVTKDTALQIDFGSGYVVKFKTTDDAGGSISLGTDGITFTPTEGDGHLELSVTRDGETRTTSLEMTGSLTYKLDGSISLTKDTVLKNIFEDGNILTITANTDASGSIIFTPDSGLNIKPSTPNALNVAVSNSNGVELVNISSIDGSINYSGGLVTASDGTSAHLLYYHTWESEMRTTGGTASLQFTADSLALTANEGATFVLDYLDGTTLEIQNGSYTDIYPTETGDAVEIVSEGINLRTNDDYPLTLEKAGNYTLNGMNVTTTIDNAEVVLPDYDTIIVDGVSYTPLDDNVTLTIGENGVTCAGGKVQIDNAFIFDVTDGSISYNSVTGKFTCAAGSIFSLQEDSNFKVVATEAFTFAVETDNDVASLALTNGKFSFVNGTRTAEVKLTGSLIYGSDGSLSLAEGTVMNFDWEDGTKLQITSSGSTGSIGFGEKGLKITSDDENLTMKLTMPYGYSTEISRLKGSLWYNSGKVILDEGTKLTGTGTLGSNAVDVTLETIDGDGYLDFSTSDGFVYGAGTGKLKVTYALGEKESTFIVNSGSVLFGNDISKIAEGTDLATDLKDFMPALNFITEDAGTYTINGQTITTSAKGLALTATDDYMTFKTSNDVVEYDGMTFAGAGNVSLSSDNVVLGAGVEATGFGEGNSFVLAEAGNVTADARIFELSEIEGTPREIPMIITVTGAQDGFTFSRTLTKESEAYLDDALDDEKFADYTSPYIDKVFTEKFISAGDSSYRIRTDAIGLEEVIGISDGATITGGASLADEPTLSYYNLVTDTTGKFTIGERTYNVSGDSSIALRARFEENAAPYASMVDSLNGTISGDFSGGNFSINGSSALKIINDTDISIVADESGYEILGLDAGASLQVAAADTYKVNGTEITAGASSVIVGTADGKASLYTLPAALADFMLHKTEAGYPAMAAVAFHPDEENPAAPTNYHSAEKWTVTSTDDLQLSAMHYSPENPTGKWVILVHGYGKKGAAMNALAEPYLAQGIDVLIVDQRTAGDSEGDWLTMGVAEANDLAIWTQEIAKTNANAQITLHGVSMGAATVMLCAALPETTNLSAMIEDCGYGNIADVFVALMSYYGPALGVSGIDLNELFGDVGEVAKIFDGGYDVADAAPIESIAAVTVPSLFIHGAADVVIPSTNADALYEASGASNKTKLIIEGAEHAQSIEIDTEAYLAAVKKLIDSSTTEIGALIDSNADSKVLRGTIYNDTITNSGTKVTIEALDGDDFITNNVDSSVTAAEFGNLIDMGDGNDTVYNHHSYNPTIYGGAGDDSIVISRGHKTFANGGEGNDSIIGRLADNPDSDWAIGGHATVLGGEDDDYINTGYTNDSSIDGGDGNDTIITCGLNNTIDGGDGKNLINLNVVDREDLSEGSFIVLNGQTTVEGFSTGFGEGSDTVYIEGESPAVDFKAEGLTLYYDNDSTKSLTFAGLSTTDKLNLYYAKDDKTVAEVFIADDEWYSVTADDLSVRDDSELWFVGATAKKNHGIDFGGISDALNITLNTDYEADVENFRINNIHSIKGGAGLTTITGSDKDDTIIAGKGKTTIDGGDGKNLIDLTDSSAAQIVLNGNTTVKGFNTSFGEGSDTIYIDGDPAGVYFKDGVLTFSNSTDSLTLSDVTTTAKVNIYHKRREVLNKGVFIADNDWYSVSSSDLSVSSGEEVYFVGPSATQNHGVDFSGITQDLNVTIDTAYIDSEDYVPTTMWINGVYSLKGGAGNTTITGSDKNDTIIAGTGATTINASEGNDFIRLGSANALVEYSSGDGNDIIEGFRADSTLSIANGSYSSETSGDDVVISVDDGKITLTGAARLSKVNIDGEKDNTGLTLTNSDDIKVTLGSTVKSADAFARTKPIVIVGNDLDNVIKGSKALDLIYGGNGDDSINSGLGNDKIWGCDGDDTLLGNAGNDYLEGGDGNDTIYGGSGTDTLKGDNGDDYLNGNEGNDKLYGGNGSDTLKGGKGNDSLWGNGGADTFIYTKDEGNDIIYGFDDTDMLQITGKFVATYSADNNVISFSIGDTSDAITLKNFTASTFNVNGTAYKISGNTLVKK